MPKEKKQPTIDSLRHAEYYGMQETFDELYAKSKNGEKFTDLMEIILSRENILLAYRNIKVNTGSMTPGTDKLDITDIGKLSPDEVVTKVRQIFVGSKMSPKKWTKSHCNRETKIWKIENATIHSKQWGTHLPNRIHSTSKTYVQKEKYLLLYN